MDRAFYVDALAKAERHIARGKEHIATQCRIVAKLDMCGLDWTDAFALLRTFLDTQQLHEEHRQRFIHELSKPKD